MQYFIHFHPNFSRVKAYRTFAASIENSFMIEVSNVSLRYGKRVLFDDVNIKFNPGNCYGIIGANGAGKSTFLKILSGEIDAQSGQVVIQKGARMAVLKQDQFAFDAYPVLETVIMGHQRLFHIMKERETLYAKADFTDADGEKASELESEFADMDGWNAENEAAELLSGLGIAESQHYRMMSELNPSEKVRILLAQALFGNPDILLLDEPTNNLDVDSVQWLIQFLGNFENTVIVVSHDRHFLDEVCTYVADIDFGKIKQFAGNYTFWYQSSQLAMKQRTEQNKKVDEKRKELEEFIRRFSANVAKSKQATSRAKLLEKLTIDDIQPSSRKYPYIAFKPERELGDQVLQVENLAAKGLEGNTLFANISFSLLKGEKIAFLSKDSLAITTFFQVLANEVKPTEGEMKWGVTTNMAFFPLDNAPYFKEDQNLVDWLRQFSVEKDESFIRGFLGRMLFSGEESLKSATVLSGGEKVRCMMSKLMLQSPNILMLDEPTDHLDLESITSLNNALVDFKGVLLLKTRDFEILNTTCNRIIEITPNGVIDKYLSYEEYVNNEQVKAQREEMYSVAVK